LWRNIVETGTELWVGWYPEMQGRTSLGKTV